jgi:large subunit ribosomal protein L35
VRALSSSRPLRDPQENENTDVPALDPHTVYTPKQERLLWENQRLRPIGSRRMRVAKATTPGVPFEQLPYQCFQEARKVLVDHRNEVLEKIKAQTERIERIKNREAGAQDEKRDGQTIRKLTRNIQGLVIEADSQDPLILKRFEDGKGKFN